MPSSEDISRTMYAQLGPAGLAARTTRVWDDQVIRLVREMLRPGQRVLDVGCGYGRIAIPLAADGYDVVGLDICEPMLDESRRRAVQSGVTIRWLQGSMCRIPLPSDTFDVVLCLWLTFHELLQEDEQLAALREMYRVLRPGGWALVDGTPYQAPDTQDPSSYDRLIAAAGIASYDTFVDDPSGQPRPYLRFLK